MGKIGRAVMLGAALGAAVWGGDWLTFGGDPARSGWAKGEKEITKENAKSMQLLWKLKIENTPRELNFLMAPVVATGIYGPFGVKDILVVGGSSDDLYAIDAELGRVLWKKTFEASVPPKGKPFWLCPDALNDTPVIDKGHGFGTQTVYVISSDGRLHALNLVNGEDRRPPFQFVPPYSKNWSLNLVGSTLFTSISQGCGGAKSGVYGLDLKDASNTVKSFLTKNGGIWGRGGVAVGADGTVYAMTGDGKFDPTQGQYSNSFVAVNGNDLSLKDYYTPPNQQRVSDKDLDMGNSTPVVFPYKGHELVAGGGKEGVLFLLDAKSLGGPDHRHAMYRSPLITNDEVNLAGRGFWGGFASWEDAHGTRYVLAPAWGPPAGSAPAFEQSNGPAPHGSIMAFKVVEKDGGFALAPAWISRDLNVPEPPAVANGVVFAVSSGENGAQFDPNGVLMTSADRAARAGKAVLYALDAETGKQLFSSGELGGFTHFSGIAVSGGRVFVTTSDNTVYAFGLKQE